ncbi:MAG: hypothetical protein V4556_08640 [Bacteroidota bacterium]
MIKNLNLLKCTSTEVLDHLFVAAYELKTAQNVFFKITEVSNNGIKVEIHQDKNKKNEYHTAEKLIAICTALFKKNFSAKEINVTAFPFDEPMVNIVDAKWLEEQLLANKMSIRKLADDTGVNYTMLSDCFKDKKIPQTMKALFFYYFNCIKHPGCCVKDSIKGSGC